MEMGSGLVSKKLYIFVKYLDSSALDIVHFDDEIL